jgi:hypothetical protein
MAENAPFRPYLVQQVKADAELRRVLREAAIDAARRIQALGPNIGSQVRAAQLVLVIQQIRDNNQDLWVQEIQPIIEKYFPKVERVADRASATLRGLLVNAIGETAAESLEQASEATSGAGFILDAVRRSRELSQRVYRNAALTSGRIERLIRSSIIQGLSAKEIAKRVKDYIRPDVKGGVAYAAMRLARTELNNAFHERQKEIIRNKPWAMAVWNLSKSHPHRDVCNDLAEDGPYEASEVPDKPHPQCLCYLSYELAPEKDIVAMIVQQARSA